MTAAEVPGMKLIGYVNIYSDAVHGGLCHTPQECMDSVPRKYQDSPGIATPVYRACRVEPPAPLLLTYAPAMLADVTGCHEPNAAFHTGVPDGLAAVFRQFPVTSFIAALPEHLREQARAAIDAEILETVFW